METNEIYLILFGRLSWQKHKSYQSVYSNLTDSSSADTLLQEY